MTVGEITLMERKPEPPFEKYYLFYEQVSLRRETIFADSWKFAKEQADHILAARTKSTRAPVTWAYLVVANAGETVIDVGLPTGKKSVSQWVRRMCEDDNFPPHITDKIVALFEEAGF